MMFKNDLKMPVSFIVLEFFHVAKKQNIITIIKYIWSYFLCFLKYNLTFVENNYPITYYLICKIINTNNLIYYKNEKISISFICCLMVAVSGFMFTSCNKGDDDKPQTPDYGDPFGEW